MPDPLLTESAFARRLVRDLAGRLAARRRLRGWDGDDVAQEVFLRLLRARRTFDPTRGTLEAFVAVVVDRALADLIRGQRTAKRAATVQSLHDWGAEEPADPRDPIPTLDRALDVATALARLPDRLRIVAELLKTETITAAARTAAVSRDTLQRRVRALRRAFETYKRWGP